MSDIALRKTIRRCTALLVISLSSIAIILGSSSELYSANAALFNLFAFVLFFGSVLYLGWSIVLESGASVPTESSDVDEESERAGEQPTE